MLHCPQGGEPRTDPRPAQDTAPASTQVSEQTLQGSVGTDPPRVLHPRTPQSAARSPAEELHFWRQAGPPMHPTKHRPPPSRTWDCSSPVAEVRGHSSPVGLMTGEEADRTSQAGPRIADTHAGMNPSPKPVCGDLNAPHDLFSGPCAPSPVGDFFRKVSLEFPHLLPQEDNEDSGLYLGGPLEANTRKGLRSAHRTQHVGRKCHRWCFSVTQTAGSTTGRSRNRHTGVGDRRRTLGSTRTSSFQHHHLLWNTRPRTHARPPLRGTHGRVPRTGRCPGAV